jgi:hypothetical protein
MDALRAGVVVLAVVHAASMLTMPFCVSPYIAQGVAFPLLLFALLPAESRKRSIGLTGLVVFGFLVALVWTKCRLFSVPLKPLSISFHLFVLCAAVRLAREERT